MSDQTWQPQGDRFPSLLRLHRPVFGHLAADNTNHSGNCSGHGSHCPDSYTKVRWINPHPLGILIKVILLNLTKSAVHTMSLLMTKAFRSMFSKNFLSLKQAYLFQKNSGPKKLKKSPPPKKLKGHFEQKTQCIGVNSRFQLKKTKEILTIWNQF